MLRALALVLAFVPAAAAAPVALPAGTRWALVAPRADTFAKDASTLLSAAGAYAPTLAPRRFNNELVRSTGVGLLGVDELRDRGVALDQPWLVFDRGNARFLLLSVRDAAPLTSALEGWTAGRLLKHRVETKVDMGRAVTFARAAGTRPAAAYLATKDRVLILLKGEAKAEELVSVLAAIDAAAPVNPGVEGALLVYLAGGVGGADTWIGLQARADGIDATGISRKIAPGWIDRAEPRSAWVRELSAFPQGSAPGDVPLRVRVNGGSLLAKSLADALAQLPVDPAVATWLRDAAALAKGPLEGLVSGIDLKSAPPLHHGIDTDFVTRLLALQLALPDAGASEPVKRAKSLPGATSKDARVSLPVAGETLTLVKDGRTLLARLDPDGRIPEPFPPPPGAPTLACAKGTPVASLRFDGPLVADALSQVGLFAAMKNDLLLAAYGIQTEFGALLGATRPLVALGCLEASGRATYTARWRIVPPPVRAP